MKKSIKVQLFNRELFLAERTAENIIHVENLLAKAEARKAIDLWVYGIIVSNGLSFNFGRLHWFQLIKRLIYKIILSPGYLRKKLSKSELLDLVLKIYDLELQANREVEESHTNLRNKTT